jgi:hypothetical protein
LKPSASAASTTSPAKPSKFDHAAADTETLDARGGLQRLKNRGNIQLRDQTAMIADEQSCGTTVMRMRARDKCVTALHLVNKPMRLEKIQRTVNRDRRRPWAVTSHPLDNVIGPDGRMALGNAAEDLATLLSEASPATRAGALGTRQQVSCALGVVVVWGGNIHFVTILHF